jgi:hypothetical protein
MTYRGGRWRTGVCIVRVESQSTGFLYTVTTNPDSAQPTGDRAVTVGDIEQAMECVWDFLVAFTELENP